MVAFILFDTINAEESQVRFKTNYPKVKLHYVSTVLDLFNLLEKEKPKLIVLEASIPKSEQGIIIGNKRIRTPFSLIQYFKKKGYRSIIYTRGTKEKSLKEIKKTYGRIQIEVVDKDFEQIDFRKVFDRYFIDFRKAKIHQW